MLPIPNIWQKGLAFYPDLLTYWSEYLQDHLLFKNHHPIKFEASGAKHLQVIRCRNFNINMTFDLLRLHIYVPSHIWLKYR